MGDSTIVKGITRPSRVIQFSRRLLVFFSLFGGSVAFAANLPECGPESVYHRFPSGVTLTRFVKFPLELSDICKGLFRGDERVFSDTLVQTETLGGKAPFILVRDYTKVQVIHEYRNTEIVANAVVLARELPEPSRSEKLRHLNGISPVFHFEANGRFYALFSWRMPWLEPDAANKEKPENEVHSWLVREDGKAVKFSGYSFSKDEKTARSEVVIDEAKNVLFLQSESGRAALALDDLQLVKGSYLVTPGAFDLNGHVFDDDPAYDAQGKIITDLPKFVSSYAKILSADNFVLDEETESAIANNSELLQLRKMMVTGSTIIMGEPGTGKTYLADLYVKGLLAGKFEESSVKNVMILDAAKLNAGTMYVGTFEARVAAFVKLAKQRKALVFIDRLSLQSGGGTSSSNALNDTISFLKNAVSSGEISMLATDNVAAYHAAFSSDQELTSLLRVYRKQEPDFEKTKAILKEKAELAGLSGLSEEVLDQMTMFSNEFNAIDAQPRKSIDFLEYIKGELKFSKRNPADITLDDVRKFAQERYQVNPAFADVSKVAEVVKNARAVLDARLVGLGEQKEETLNFVKQLLTGTADPDKPAIRSITIGPRGTGKTEFAKSFALAIGVPFELIEMNGAAGHSEPGVLLNQIAAAIKQNPFSVIVLDEIEKAHPTVQAAVLGILNNGYFTITSGRVSTRVDARKCSIFMTSNAGDHVIAEVFQSVSDAVAAEATAAELADDDLMGRRLEERLHQALTFEKLEALIIKEGILSGPLLDRASLKSLLFPTAKVLFRKIVALHVDRILDQISKSRRKPVTLTNKEEVILELVARRYRPGVSNRSSTEYLDRMLRTLAAESITNNPTAASIEITWDLTTIKELSDCNQSLRRGIGFQSHAKQ